MKVFKDTECQVQVPVEEIFQNAQTYHGQVFWVTYAVGEVPTERHFHAATREFLAPECFKRTQAFLDNQAATAVLTACPPLVA